MRRALVSILGLGLGLLPACGGPGSHELDHQRIHVSPDAQLRTDTVGDGQFADMSSFVLVDAENDAAEGAYVTLGGELTDATGATVATLRAQSLWIPAGEQRTYALVDRDRQPRPTASSARIYVRGANVPASPPVAHVGEVREVADNGKIVVQGTLHNDAERAGNIMVIASFHDDHNKPLTRPFSMVHVGAHEAQAVQFIGPPGAVHATIFVGDGMY
jgi:hypothetical protein